MIDVQEPYYDCGNRRAKDPPYIGITGFTNVPDVVRIIDAYYKHRKIDHVLMVGILVSKSVIVNGFHHEMKKRYPAAERVPDLLNAASDDLVMRAIHYNTRFPDQIYDDVVTMMEFLDWKGMVDAFQFNVRFPPPDRELRSIASKYPNVKIIVQVNNNAMSDLGPETIGKHFSMVSEPGNYVLIDPSGGTGKDIDFERSMEFHAAIKKHANVVIGFAGGFSQHNVASRVKMYKEVIPSFCIDAESKLRTDKDELDIKASIEYIKNFFEAMT